MQPVDATALLGDDLHIPVCNESLKSRIEMQFSEMDDGVTFYKNYAYVCGSVHGGTNRMTLEMSYGPGKVKRVLQLGVGGLSENVGGQRVGLVAWCMSHASLGFFIYKFIEGHSHEMVLSDYRHLMKVNRKLDYGQKLFLAKCAKKMLVLSSDFLT